MNIPFTSYEFLDIFKVYNNTIYPLQFFFYFLAICTIWFLIKKKSYTSKLINIILSFYWIWMGFVYHIIFFSKINLAAYLFGVIFALQGIFFMYFGIVKNQIEYSLRTGIRGFFAWTIIVYSLIIYPVLGTIIGHKFPYSPTFGLPCPTTIFTFGVLLFCKGVILRKILIIPLIWSVIGFLAAIKLGIIEDTGLLIAGLISFIFIFEKKHFKNE